MSVTEAVSGALELVSRPFGTITKRGDCFTVSLDVKKLREIGVIETVDGQDQLVDEDIRVTKLYDPERGGFFVDLPDEYGED